MQEHGSKYFAHRPPLTPGIGSIGQNSTFSKHSHIAYQIKGNQEMQQHGSKYFARRPFPDPAFSQISSFSEQGHVAYQTKGNHQMQQHGSK